MSTLKVEKIQHPNSASVALTLDTSGYLALQAGSASTPAIQGPSDPNTGIFFPAADTIAFAEGGTEVLRIDSNGRVGIGTSSISNTLDIRATGANVGIRSTTSGQNQYIFFSNTADSTNGLILQTGSELRLQQQDNVSGSRITFYTKDSERVRITDTGLVGVGTTTPLLAGARNGITLRANSSNGVELLLQSTSATDGTFVGYAIAAVGNDVYYVNRLDGFHSWITGSTGATERMRLDASGRLLVGTSSDSSSGRLVVQGSPAASGVDGVLVLKRASNNPASGIQGLGVIDFKDLSDGHGASIQAVSDGGWNTPSDCPTRLVFSTTADGASSPSERWRIDNAGSLVGVAGSAFVAPYVYNTTTATAANVNVDATGFLRRSTSSIKYKTNVETIQDQYADAILGCRPVWYQSTCEADKPEWGHWGFIAEEVAEIDPRLCFFKEEEDGTLEPEGVQYDRFVPHLLNLIKRQQQAIEDLQAEVAALKAS